MRIKLSRPAAMSAQAGLHGVDGCQWLKLRVSPAGRRTWLYLRRDKGRYIKTAIGRLETMSPQEALEKCLTLAGRKDRHARPPTLGEILRQWIEAGTRGPKMRRHQLYYVEVLAPLVNLRLDAIGKADAEAWHLQATRERGATGANNAMRAAKAAINWAVCKGLASGDNPFARVKPNKTETRSRFLHGEELERFRLEMGRLSTV